MSSATGALAHTDAPSGQPTSASAARQQDGGDKKDITSWASKDGSFKRQVSKFRDEVKQGGKYEAERGRYHLYVSLAW